MYTLANGFVRVDTVTNAVTIEGVKCVTVGDAARVGGVTPSRIRQLLLEGAFPRAVRVGGRAWMIPLEDVQRWAHVGWRKHRRRKPEPVAPDVTQLALPGDTSSSGKP